jgi:hypothetical protein
MASAQSPKPGLGGSRAMRAEIYTLEKPWIQPTKLLSSLFESVDEQQRISVLHVGPARQDTVDFFSNYRCILNILDLFAELPITSDDDSFQELLQFPPGTQFDVCLFWDLFNFLDEKAILAFQAALRPYLKKTTRAHAFSLHNLDSPRNNHVYGIKQQDSLSIRNRAVALPGYEPHSKTRLQDLLTGFNFDHCVLLQDSRLEIILRSKA